MPTIALNGLSGLTGRTLEQLSDVNSSLDALTQSLDTPYWPISDLILELAKALSPSPLEGATATGTITPALTEILAGLASTSAVGAPVVSIADLIALLGLEASSALGTIGLVIVQTLAGVSGLGVVGIITVTGAWTPVEASAETWTTTAASSESWVKTTPSSEAWT